MLTLYIKEYLGAKLSKGQRLAKAWNFERNYSQSAYFYTRSDRMSLQTMKPVRNATLSPWLALTWAQQHESVLHDTSSWWKNAVFRVSLDADWLRLKLDNLNSKVTENGVDVVYSWWEGVRQLIVYRTCCQRRRRLWLFRGFSMSR